MAWNINNYSPVYMQLMQIISWDIIKGKFKAGDKLPSVRDLAVEASVNPNTMQKALSELERTGIVYSKRTSGRFITEDGEVIKKLKVDLARKEIEDFLDKMNNMGFSGSDTLELISKIVSEGGK
ncbi:MAG: GntR family transcriptional regulator [Lachnospiraceae bacterium]|jgi:DNA-binding transcriptional regulator YhcF (GntR family)|nr:GntR family transcriptional regulator [Lachnospiraceae bacterium]